MGDFNVRLKILRKEKDLTQDALAKLTGVSRSTIGMYESGKREPDFEFVEKCSELFGVSTDYLLMGDESEGYYTDPETARIAQQMFEDPQMRSLFHMKRTMEPEKFQAHYDMMKKLYEMEHPEVNDFDGA